MCFFFFFSLWHHLFQLEVREGAPIQQLRWKELEYRILFCFFSVAFFILAVCQCPHRSSSASFSENTGIISGIVRGEGRREHPLHGHATSGGQQMNRRPGSSPGWAKSGWTDNDDEEMRWSPSPCPRERDGIDFSMMAHNWSASWMLVASPALGEEKGGWSRQVEKRLIPLFCGYQKISTVITEYKKQISKFNRIFLYWTLPGSKSLQNKFLLFCEGNKKRHNQVK